MAELEVEGLNIIEGIEKIQETSLFEGLSFGETRTLAGICVPVFKRKGDLIIEEEALGEGLYFIVKGDVEVYTIEDGEEKQLAILKPGDIFGEMSLIEDMLTSSNVRAVNDVQLLKIMKNDLFALMENDDRLAMKVYRSFCRVLSDRLRKANEKLTEGDS